ncbi:MAG: flagellar hook-basal body complex protein [Hyphomonas sp.]|uniref:flagellar hook protein FlgE n=1 Tax=Hyphomonas sp. TaxID=87 RepID=UPI0034A03E58
MSISSSLNAGVMGLSVNGTRLAAISDNIANAGTNGYKRSQVDFSSMVLQQRSSSYSAGGVRVETYKDIGNSGALISTGSSTDVAVSGRGLLPVTDASGVSTPAAERSLRLTPTGAFFPDKDGNLRTQSGLFLLGWPADSSGNIGNVVRNSGVDLEPINLASAQFSATPTSKIGLGINLPAGATRSTGTGEPYMLPIEYYDNIGRGETLTFQFTPTVPGSGASNQWTVEIFDSATGAASIGELDITFSDSASGSGRILSAAASNGATYDPATGMVSLTLPHGPVEVFIGQPGESTGISQFAAPFAPTAVTKDGTPIGSVQSIEIDDRGYLQALYNTGFRRTLYQIPVADVPNMIGLRELDAQSYGLSGQSGNLYLWDANNGPVGGVAGYSLMESTTDIAAELTDLIETQRAYSSNAKIVQTVDDMLQETTNLKR